MNDKEHGYAIYVTQASIAQTSNELTLSVFNGTTNTWNNPYTVNVARAQPLKNLIFTSSFANNPIDSNQYSLSIIYAGSPFGSQASRSNVYGFAAFGGTANPITRNKLKSRARTSASTPQSSNLGASAGVQQVSNGAGQSSDITPEDITLTGSSSIVQFPHQSFIVKNISWQQPTNLTPYSAVFIARDSKADFFINSINDPRIISKSLDRATTSFEDSNRPTTDYYKVLYIKTTPDEKGHIVFSQNNSLEITAPDPEMILNPDKSSTN